MPLMLNNLVFALVHPTSQFVANVNNLSHSIWTFPQHTICPKSDCVVPIQDGVWLKYRSVSSWRARKLLHWSVLVVVARWDWLGRMSAFLKYADGKRYALCDVVIFGWFGVVIRCADGRIFSSAPASRKPGHQAINNKYFLIKRLIKWCHFCEAQTFRLLVAMRSLVLFFSLSRSPLLSV